VGHRSPPRTPNLSKETRDIQDHPVLDDLPVAQAEKVERVEGGAFPSRRDALLRGRPFRQARTRPGLVFLDYASAVRVVGSDDRWPIMTSLPSGSRTLATRSPHG
jgi:hypothetical protein